MINGMVYFIIFPSRFQNPPFSMRIQWFQIFIASIQDNNI